MSNVEPAQCLVWEPLERNNNFLLHNKLKEIDSDTEDVVGAVFSSDAWKYVRMV